MVATLIRTTGDWDLAEECAQDAFTLALQRWPRDGIPGPPGAWLTTAARHRGIPYRVPPAHLLPERPPGVLGVLYLLFNTDWTQIAGLYEQLARFLPTAVVELNHAVAVGMAQGPAAGLPLVAALEASGKLSGCHLLPATRADFLRRLGRLPEAADAYQKALDLASTDAERRFLCRRLAETGGPASP